MDADWSVEQYRFPNGQVPYNGFVRALRHDARREALALEPLLERAHVLREPQSKAVEASLNFGDCVAAYESSMCSDLDGE